jgi:uncharacterized membrane protein
MNKNILSIFRKVSDAENAFEELRSSGIKQEDVSLVMREDMMSKTDLDQQVKTHDKSAKGATTGAMVGGIAGILAGLGAIAVPGLGALLVGGPIASALGLTGAAAAATSAVAGGAAGAAVGGIAGGLVGLGLDEKDAHDYENHIKRGAILFNVSVNPDDEMMVKDILNRHHAMKVRTVHE